MIGSLHIQINKKNSRVAVLLFVIAVAGVIFWFFFPAKLFKEPTSYVIEDSQGKLLGATVSSDGQWRFPYNENVSPKFAACIISFEDRRFFLHNGVDPLAIVRAIRQNISRKKIVSGGSTISMQVIRLSRNKPRNLWQKFIEGLLAARMEMSYSKKEILALYSSYAPFGGNVVGLDAAAWRYYGRPPSQLSWGEMAALAVLPNSPSLVYPGKNREVLLRKRNALLDHLLKEGFINGSTCELSKFEALPGEPKSLPQLAPHLLQRYIEETKRNENAPTKVQTSLSLELQKQVSRIVEQHHQHLKGNGINNAAAIVLDVETGNTLAYVGNIYHPENSELESHVDILRSQRSPGSTLKPLLYAASMSDGLILPNSLLADVPMQVGGYTPKNFDQQYSGAVAASEALARSLNIPAVKLLQQYKYQRFYELLKEAGIKTLNRPAETYGLSLVLGGCEVTPWQLAGVYASMARVLNHQHRNKGKVLSQDFHAPNYQLQTTKSASTNLPSSSFNLLDISSIWYTFQAMEEVMRPGEEGLWQQFSSSQRIAWKTGTSFGFRDGWAVGVTPRYVVAVWTGNADGEGRPGLIGVQTAAPILFDIFRLLPTGKWFQEPDFNYAYLPVCKESGYRANADCIHVDTVMVPQNGNRVSQCNYHKLVHLDSSGKFQVTENCTFTSQMRHQSWFVLPPTMEWYYKQQHHDYASLPPYKEGCVELSTRQMDLVYPQAGAKIYVPVELSGEQGKTIFTATHRNSDTKIFWHLDERFVAETDHFHQIAVNPTPGKHTLTLVDEKGETISRAFEILEKRKTD